jgi:hypothetical protein
MSAYPSKDLINCVSPLQFENSFMFMKASKGLRFRLASVPLDYLKEKR